MIESILAMIVIGAVTITIVSYYVAKHRSSEGGSTRAIAYHLGPPGPDGTRPRILDTNLIDYPAPIVPRAVYRALGVQA